MDVDSRRKVAVDAISMVLKGAVAGEVESEIVDFKEEAGTVDPAGQRRPIASQHEPAAVALAEAVACHAMSDNGGVLVVGVADKKAGADAFVGSFLDLEWLRRRVHALTIPNLTIGRPEEQVVSGVRIYLVDVPPALSEVRVGGKLRTRVESDCVELTGDRARQFLERRQRFDWSDETSGLHLSHADQGALTRTHEIYAEAQGRGAGSDRELMLKLNVAADDSDDPVLKNAGALLFCPYEPTVERLDVQITKADGAPAHRRESLRAPMVLAFDEAWRLIDGAFPADAVVVGPRRRSVRVIPEEALREALVNAIMHRDYRMPRAPIIALCMGDPAKTFKVVSPGEFPDGVGGGHLLATRSRPRNLTLADAMRTLGYAEKQGIGIPTMFRSLLRDGHPEPEIWAESGDVVCRLTGGAVDVDVRRFFDGLYEKDTALEYDVRAHVAITMLLSSTPLHVDRLCQHAQCSDGEADETMCRLVDVGALERLADGSRVYRLTRAARSALQSRVSYKMRSSLDEARDAVLAALATGSELGSAEVAVLLGVKQPRASAILGELRKRGDIQPVANSRGRGVRYRLP